MHATIAVPGNASTVTASPGNMVPAGGSALAGHDSHLLGRVEGFQLVYPFTLPSPLTKLRLAQHAAPLRCP